MPTFTLTTSTDNSSTNGSTSIRIPKPIQAAAFAFLVAGAGIFGIRVAKKILGEDEDDE